MKKPLSLAIVLFSSALALADVPDLTGSLEYMGNPASSRWPSSAISRQVQDLQPHRGKIYTSGGEWGNNTGPCPCFAVDPYSGAYTNEFDAGTDAIYEFKEFSDGRLYTSAIDIHEGAANEGHTFRRSTNGQWTALKTCNVGSITNLNWQGYYIHNWDMAEYKKWTFVCGYGISGSTNRCETKMFNATPSLKDCYRICKPGYVYTNELGWVYHYTSKQLYRRFCAFLPFDDDCFAIPAQPTRGVNIQQWDFEEWRWDDEKNQFLCQTNTWARMAPGVTAEMASFHYPSNESYTVQLWHPTQFKDRVLYILGGHDYNVTPWAAFSAVNENHHIKATRIELGGADVKPFDIYANEDAVFLVAAQAGPASSTVTNSVWKSTDGVNFTKLFTFTRTRQASALCYYDGHFYFGMGSNADTKKGWPKVTGTEVAGNIYRIPYQLEPLGVEAETNRLSCTEGATGSIRFRLTAAPVTNVTLNVRASANPAITVQTTSLAFTPGDWNTWKTVSYAITENTDTAAHPTGAIICGVDGAGIASGSARVTVVDNDAVPVANGLSFDEITATSVRATANVTDLGKLNGAANASVRVAFELFTDAKYTNLVTAATNTVTATGSTSATLGGLVHDTRYAVRATVLGSGGLTAVLAGQVVTDEEPIPNEDQIPELRNYLVYEGFSTNDYKVSTGQYGTTIQSGPTGIADSIGTAPVASKWGTAGSSQLLWYKPIDGLRLPRAMRAIGFKSRGTSVGTNPGANAQAARGAYRQLADGVLAPSNTSTGKYCFRVLLNVDETAFNAAKKESWLITTSNTTTTSVNAYGAGFCRTPTANNYGVHLSEPSTIGFYIARNTNNAARAYMRTVSATGEIKSTVLGEARTGVTYIFYAEAELKDGADIIRGGYQSVADYTTDITWMAESTNDVFTANSYPTAMMFGGCYGTNGGYFRADEFAVGTRLEDVIATKGSEVPETNPTDPEPGDPEPSEPEPVEPVELTDALEYVARPSAARWSEPTKRPVTDLMFYGDKLFVGGGATELNAGPCPLQWIDPYTKTYTVERSAGTENISVFKEFSDGRLYVPSQDPRDYDADYSDDGHVFVRDRAGNWNFYKNVPKGSAKDTDGSLTEAYIHNWDMEEYKGRTFVCGYGISFTTNGCASWTSATPHWTSSRMLCYFPTNVWDYTKKQWKGPSGAASYNTYRRELQFMKFNDRLFAVPYQNVPAGIPKQYYDGVIEVHRFDETTQRFVQMTNRCSRVFPGLSTNDFRMAKPMNTYGVPYYTDELKLWHTTPFSNRVFYVVSPYETYTNMWGSARKGYHETQYPYPMFACAADPTDDGLFTSSRLDFGTEEYPFDFLVKGPVMYALTAHYNPSDKQVRHSVWRTRDAKSFERLLSFNFHQYLISMEYYDGMFYFGAGYKGASQVAYELDATADASGGVYRVPYSLEANSVIAETNRITAVEGASGTVRFRLASAPSTNVTLQVRTTGASALVADTTSLTFSKTDWNVWKTARFHVDEDPDLATPATGAIICGAGGSGFGSASARVTIEYVEPEIPGEADIPERSNYLVYEGFSANDYTPVTSGYGAVIQNGPSGVNDSIGTASASTKWDPSGSSQMLWFKPSDGLTLPPSMRLKGFKSRGTSVGTNPDKSSSNMRGAFRPLAEGVLSPDNTPTGKFYFRALLNVDEKALNVAKKEGWLISSSNTTETAVNNYGVAFCRAPTAKNYGVTTSEPSTIGFYIARNTNDTARAYVRTVGADGSPKSKAMGVVKPGVTYIFYAEVEIKEGGDIVRSGYQNCRSYTNEIPWMVEVTNDVFTATSYPTAMAFGGCYGTNGGYFRADELAVATKLEDVLEVAGTDEEGGDPGPGTDPDPGPGTEPDPGPGTDPDPEPGESQVNYWIAAEGSDGLASTPANWSAGAPTASSDIVVSPTNSSVTLIWDAAATQTINSYHQYGLTNEVRTTFSTDFPVLTVKGDLVVEGGVLTHPRGVANVSANVSRLKLSVGGDFVLGTNAMVNLKGKGLAGGQKPSGSTAGSHAASCDGYAKVYGSVYRPEHPGSGSNGSNNWGGGALWLEVAGAATIDGTITVRPEEKDNIKQPAAGSVYVKAASCSGSGYIYADYAATGYYNGGAGSGGRVAIELTTATALGLAESHISVHGINAGGANGGGGTIFVKTADPAMPNGTLILDDTRTKSYGARWHKPTAVTAIPAGETWTFDAIKIKNYGVLAIPAGTKLVLPKGIASVTASSTRQGGLLYQGGEIDWGEGPYEFAQPWIFQANKPFTFDGNVTVKQNGCLGCLQFMGSNDLSDFTKCDVVVNGDLTVEQGGYVWAECAGPDLNVDRTTSAYHGGQTGSLTYAAAYDSILDPTLPGWGMATGDRATSQPGGGVLKLTVNGALTVDGTITAYANKNGNNSEGAGGTVNIRAKTLSGAGKITADCYKFTSQQYSGGGGRIAVRLSEQAIGTDGIFSRISAKGATVVTSGGYKPSHSSSAGTVYLQGKDDAEGAGTVRVCNDANEQSVDPYTPFPTSASAKGADAAEALKDVTLFIGDCAKVRVQATAEVRGLALDATGRLDLNGQTLTVASATVNGQAVAAGTYAAGAVGAWLLDSSEGGSGCLIVTGGVAPEPEAPVLGGGESGDASVSFGADAQGNATFGVKVSNAKAGLWYRAYATERLGEEFKPYGAAVQATADGVLPIVVPTEGKPALFVKIVVSTTAE